MFLQVNLGGGGQQLLETVIEEHVGNVGANTGGEPAQVIFAVSTHV